MGILNTIWSSGLVLAAVGCGLISIVLVALCCAADFCGCEKAEKRAAQVAVSETVDFTWLRAA